MEIESQVLVCPTCGYEFYGDVTVSTNCPGCGAQVVITREVTDGGEE